ncbi:putative bifunctional diguanylate cyclase/phosphodiesterase [Nautilia lithotrophica]
MKKNETLLVNEIKVLQKAAQLHAKYSISQYKKVLNTLQELQKEKELLEEKVKERTKHLEEEYNEKISYAQKLDKIAKYDQLTGLANRYLFFNELKLLKKEYDLMDSPFALLFIDLDGFKFINDTYGHNIGDKVLQIVASKLKSKVRKEDLVSRIGGDEFTIILKNIDSKEKISEIATKIINSFKKPLKIDDINLYLGASIGIYTIKKHDSFQDIITKADIAMYEAKKAGKGTYLFFDESMKSELIKITKLRNYIKNALKNNKFINCFQPIVLSTNYKIKGAEALLRLIQNNKLISPTIFIPILEDDIHLIKEVTFWQISEIVKLTKKLDIFFTINLSAKLLGDYDLIEYLEKLKQKTHFDTSKIYFEVTETALSSNLTMASNILLKLKEMGFVLSLDDFGTGYSSLAYLRELPFDIIKIDKKFIDNLPFSEKDQKLLKSIINMANILDMKIVLEGIETKEQLKKLPQDENIKYQGYHFHKPYKIDKLLSCILH